MYEHIVTTRTRAWWLTCKDTHDIYSDAFDFSWPCLAWTCVFMHTWCHCISNLFDPVYAVMRCRLCASVSVFICAICYHECTGVVTRTVCPGAICVWCRLQSCRMWTRRTLMFPGHQLYKHCSIRWSTQHLSWSCCLYSNCPARVCVCVCDV